MNGIATFLIYFTLKGQKISLCTAETELLEGFSVEYEVTDNWDTGFQGEIKIVNELERMIEGWKLTFTCNFEVLNYWNCELSENADETYTICTGESKTEPTEPSEPETSPV